MEQDEESRERGAQRGKQGHCWQQKTSAKDGPEKVRWRKEVDSGPWSDAAYPALRRLYRETDTEIDLMGLYWKIRLLGIKDELGNFRAITISQLVTNLSFLFVYARRRLYTWNCCSFMNFTFDISV